MSVQRSSQMFDAKSTIPCHASSQSNENTPLTYSKYPARAFITSGIALSKAHVTRGRAIFSQRNDNTCPIASIIGCTCSRRLSMDCNNGEKSRVSAHSAVASVILSTVSSTELRISHTACIICVPVSPSSHALRNCSAMFAHISETLLEMLSIVPRVSSPVPLLHTLLKLFPIDLNSSLRLSNARLIDLTVLFPSFSQAFLKTSKKSPSESCSPTGTSSNIINGEGEIVPPPVCVGACNAFISSTPRRDFLSLSFASVVSSIASAYSV